VVTKHTTAP